MKTTAKSPMDHAIQRAILEEIDRAPNLDCTEVGVEVRDGIATLEGYVDSYAKKYEAERAALRVEDLRAVANELVVRLPLSRERTDTDVARAVADALEWSESVPHRQIKAKVDSGFVMLQGTVDWPYQRAAAQEAIEHINGVRGITNSIVASNPAPAASLAMDWKPAPTSPER